MRDLKFSIVDYDVADSRHKESFGALNREWLERYFRVEDQDAEAFADPKGKILDKGGVILMALLGETSVCTGSLFTLEDGMYEIAKMAVTKKAQGRGIGEQLLLALIACAREKGARKLFMVSNTSLETAIRLYRRHGFTDSKETHHAHYERGNITQRAM